MTKRERDGQGNGAGGGGRGQTEEGTGRTPARHKEDGQRTEDSQSTWLNNGAQGGPITRGLRPRRQSPVVDHRALFPPSRPTRKNYKHQPIRSTGDRTGRDTANRAGLQLISGVGLADGM